MQAEDGWFTRRCRKVNRTASVLSAFVPTFLALGADDPITTLVHDPSRKLLYALSDRSAIHVVWLGATGADFVRAFESTGLANEARRMYPHTPLLDAATFRILSLHTVPQSESTNVHLVAVTSNGPACQAHRARVLAKRRGVRPGTDAPKTCAARGSTSQACVCTSPRRRARPSLSWRRARSWAHQRLC